MPQAQQTETLYPVEPDVLRLKLCHKQPYLRTLLYRLRARPMPGLRTFGVDYKWSWFYDPEGVPFTPEEQIWALFHECNHILRKHDKRRLNRDKVKWNIAGDIEINHGCPSFFQIPRSVYTPKTVGLPEGELAEWYFDRIDKWDVHAREDASAAHPGSGKCTVEGCDSQDTDPEVGKDYEVIRKGVIHTPVCGGVATGEGSGEETDSDSDAGPSELEKEAVTRHTAEEIANGSGRGTAPADLQRWASEYLNPKVPWQKVLKTVARRSSIEIAGVTEQTYQKPSRRDFGNFILPKRHAKKTIAAFYIDTSGSINEDQLNQAVTEVRSALGSNTADMTLSFVHTDVYSTTKLSSKGKLDRIKQELKSGGTDMRECFPHAAKLRPKPNLLVILTDCITPWPENAPPGMQTIVVWGSTYGRHSGEPPAWAKVIKIDYDED